MKKEKLSTDQSESEGQLETRVINFLAKKCTNCKYAGVNRKNVPEDLCAYAEKYPLDTRTFKNTTNSKHSTHCDKHEFVSQKDL